MSLVSPPRPNSDVSSTGSLNKDALASLPLAPNQASRPPLAPQGSTEKPSSHSPSTEDDSPPQQSTTPPSNGTWRSHHLSSIMFISAIVVMVVWPWVFYGIVKQKGSIVMSRSLTNVVQKHPQDVDYFVTAIASAISFLIGYLFQTSVTKLAQNWMVLKETDVFRLAFFSALRHQNFIWSLGALPSVFKSATRLGLVFTVLLYIGTLVLITPGLTALLHPQMIVRQANLSGTEIDFSSSSPDCLDWFNNDNVLLEACGWSVFNGFKYTTCFGENQMVDALESGRNNILSLSSNNTESIGFTQLDGVHFLGPMKGVMPRGPNGLSAFAESLSHWPDAASIIPNSYNYTLHLQGLKNNVNCRYDTQSPITLVPTGPPDRFVSLFDGSCPPGGQVLSNPVFPVFIDKQTNNSLGYWACRSLLPGGSENYDLYLRGDGAYANMTGNVTCSVSLAQSAIYPVDYQNRTNLFAVKNASNPQASTISPALMRGAINTLGHIIWGGQQFSANFVAESVITSGVKTYGLEPFDRDDMYLRLYEAMIQGLLDYQLTYIRLLYSTDSVPRTTTLNSCTRTVEGTIRYAAMGWSVTDKIGAYMIPLTLVTGTSLILILIAVFTTHELPTFDPTNPISLMVSSTGEKLHVRMKNISDPEDTAAWEYHVEYNKGEGRFVPKSQ